MDPKQKKNKNHCESIILLQIFSKLSCQGLKKTANKQLCLILTTFAHYSDYKYT